MNFKEKQKYCLIEIDFFPIDFKNILNLLERIN
jgi:hypothetical protein